MKDKVELDVFYPHPPERVWRALTEANALGNWFMPTDFKPVLGLRFRFEGLKRSGKSIVEGVVLELEAFKKLVYSWDDGEEGSPGVVSWTLQPKDGGTQVRLEHEPTEAPKPYVLIEANLNWRYALYASLPVTLQLMRAEAQRLRVPIVYVEEVPEQETEPKRRAGFRQEEVPCC